MGSAGVAYRVHDAADRWLGVYGGVRAFDIEADVALDVPALGFEGKRRASVGWVDGIVGLRGHAPLGGRFAASGLADIGGFGIGASSDLEWQVQATLDHAFTEQLIGRLGYRYVRIDRDGGGLGLDLDLHGPLIGVTWAF
jgi:opacity protein-like surface antigen